jgi:hypothetical protein
MQELVSLQKEKLIMFSTCIGAILILCSWYLSYPLSIDSPYDFIFDQTKEEYQSDNFMVNYYNWTKPTSILSHFRVIHYLQVRKSPSDVLFGDDIHTADFPENVRNYDCIAYTVGLGKNFLLHNYSQEILFYESRYNIVFNSGFSYIAIKAESS